MKILRWIDLVKTDILGSYCFEETNFHPITVNQDSNLNLLEDEFIPCLEIAASFQPLRFLQD